MKYNLLFLLVLLGNFMFAQKNPKPPARKNDTVQRNGPNRELKEDTSEPIEITIKDYKIISFVRDTTFLDTTLTIQKEYKYNYLRRDDFELMPFSNMGQTYNQLGLSFERKNMYPKIGAKAKHFNYAEKEDVNYYSVATPMSDLLFKTTLEEGQLLDALVTFNTSPRLNFSLGYEGLRSLGKYQFNQGESGNFKATTNYETKNKRYSLRGHLAVQDAVSEESGGLTDGQSQFESGDDDFKDRVKVDVRFNLAKASNKILGKRYFFEHKYKLLRKQKDSSYIEKTSLALGHQFSYETKFHRFNQSIQNEYFGNGLLAEITDKATLKTMFNQVSLDFYNSVLGNLQAKISVYNYNYYFNSILVTQTGRIENQLKGEEINLGATYEKFLGGFLVKGDAQYSLSGKLTSNIIDASASYRFNEKNILQFGFHASTRMPDFNYLLHQSDYVNYNWQNTDTFKNERINSIQAQINSKTWGDISAKVTNIDNYAYFTSDPTKTLVEGQEQAYIRPYQETNSMQHIKVKYAKEFRLGRFALNNTVMYQSVQQTNDIINVPQFVTRNTLYLSSDIFKKAMYLQTGVTLKYFTSYTMDAYNPVLGEFYSQNSQKLGGYPLLDFFINAKVQQTRIYLKAEHFNSMFSKHNYYSAPNYPYRDFIIRFGLVWNFFS